LRSYYYFFIRSAILAAHFQATWAPQCKQVEASLVELAKELKVEHLTF
jgi:hypothetical protein